VKELWEGSIRKSCGKVLPPFFLRDSNCSDPEEGIRITRPGSRSTLEAPKENVKEQLALALFMQCSIAGFVKQTNWRREVRELEWSVLY
jgi:hypothetical protein